MTDIAYFILKETTVVPAIVTCLSGRRICILACDALFPPLNPVLRRLVGLFSHRTEVLQMHDVLNDLEPAWQHCRPLLADLYEPAESAIEEYCNFERIATMKPPYGEAARHAILTYVGVQLATVYAVRELAERRGETILGLNGLLRVMSEAVTDRRFPRFLLAGRMLRPVANLLLAVLLSVVGAMMTMRYVRPAPGKPEHCRLAMDHVYDRNDHDIAREILEDGPVVLVDRTGHPDRKQLDEDIRKTVQIDDQSGVIALWNWPAEVLKVIGDTLHVWRYCRHLETRMFYAVATLPLKSTPFRALFNRIRPDVFWCRDLYNPEHILRRHELNLVGGKAWSVLNGVPSYTYLYPHFRHFGLDRLYLMTPDLFDARYRDRWPQDMDVSKVGSFRFSRSDYSHRLHRRPPHILVLMSIWTGEPEFLAAIRSLAEEFPDRDIIVQIKPSFLNTRKAKAMQPDLDAMPSNVRLSGENPYKLFREASFAVSDPSIVVFEAIEFGIPSFMFDIPRLQKIAFHRSIEGFTAEDGGTIARRIRGIESGETPYPVEALSNIMRFDGVNFIDSFRQDMGLTSRQNPIPVWNRQQDMNGRPQSGAA